MSNTTFRGDILVNEVNDSLSFQTGNTSNKEKWLGLKLFFSVLFLLLFSANAQGFTLETETPFFDGAYYSSAEFADDDSDLDVLITGLNSSLQSITKLLYSSASPCDTESIDTITACDSYVWINGVTYTSSNSTDTDTLTNVMGCDSVITLNLTINNSSTGIDIITACDSYVWINGVTYTSSNSADTDTLTNVMGCDSVITLNLTINNSSTGIDTIAACDSYTWINGVTYTSSNSTDIDTLVNTAGCDSVVTLFLTIDTMPEVSVTIVGNVLSTSISGASYQWLDCNNGHAIIGANAQSFIPDSSGNYAVQVSLKSCTDTSDCASITYVENFEQVQQKSKEYSGSANLHGTFYIEFGSKKESVDYIVVDNFGVIVLTVSLQDKEFTIVDLSGYTPGIYYLIVTVNGLEHKVKLEAFDLGTN